MFLSAYHVDGDPTALAAAHERLGAAYPPEALAWHACVVGEHSIVVLDGCPSRAEFTVFSQSPEFRTALAEAGLPTQRIVPLGEVRSMTVAAEAVTR